MGVRGFDSRFPHLSHGVGYIVFSCESLEFRLLFIRYEEDILRFWAFGRGASFARALSLGFWGLDHLEILAWELSLELCVLNSDGTRTR